MEKKREDGPICEGRKHLTQENTTLLLQIEKQQIIDIKAKENVSEQAFHLERNHLVESSKHLQETMEMFQKMSDEIMKSEESTMMELNLVEKQMENTETIVSCLKQNVDYLESVYRSLKTRHEQDQINTDKCKELEMKIVACNKRIGDLKKKFPIEDIDTSINLDKEYENLKKALQDDEKYLEELRIKRKQEKDNNKKKIHTIKNMMIDESASIISLTQQKEKLHIELNDLTESMNKLETYFLKLESEVQELKHKNEELETCVQAEKQKTEHRVSLENRLQSLKTKLQESTKLTNDLLTTKLKLIEDVHAQKLALVKEENDKKMQENKLKECKIKSVQMKDELEKIIIQKDIMDEEHKISLQQKSAELEIYIQNEERKHNELRETAENIRKEIKEATTSIEENDNTMIEEEIIVLQKKSENLDINISHKKKTYEMLSKKAETLEGICKNFNIVDDSAKKVKKNASEITTEEKDDDKKAAGILKSPKRPATPSKKVTFNKITYQKLPSDSSDGLSFLDDILEPDVSSK